MNKEDILKEIEKIKKHLKDLKKLLEECEYERWKPKKGDIFFFVDWDGDVEKRIFDPSNINHIACYNAYNCFETREQADAEAEKILVRRMLEDIARRLNRGRKIDWDDENQEKYFIDYDNARNKFSCGYGLCTSFAPVYCLDKTFKNAAIQEIGEERLKKYLRNNEDI